MASPATEVNHDGQPASSYVSTPVTPLPLPLTTVTILVLICRFPPLEPESTVARLW
ncbi:hypothetical protein TorRG33x02_286890 [Trema orientale]|uniref:Uncharacterized protein n=1 Tax=Trema orientale TaxID=63057 RepID=A0A2P5CFD7_TREOI|nr:hypothetical protein TorRG33x02_286890 [Trema orientale]